MLYRPEGGGIGLGLPFFWLLLSSIWSSLVLLSVLIKSWEHQARSVPAPEASAGRGQGVESHNHLAISAFESMVSPSRKLGGQGNVRLRKTQRGEYTSRSRQNGGTLGALPGLAWPYRTTQLSDPCLGTVVSGAHLSLHLLVLGLLAGPFQLSVSTRELLAQQALLCFLQRHRLGMRRQRACEGAEE